MAPSPQVAGAPSGTRRARCLVWHLPLIWQVHLLGRVGRVAYYDKFPLFGKCTLWETELTKDQLKISEEETPLMKKLSILAAIVGKWAYIMAALTFVLFTLNWFLGVMFGGGMDLVSN